MFKKTQLCAAVLAAFAGSVYAQDAQTTPDEAPAAKPQRVEITGSRIKRAETEGSLPVTVVTREQLDKSGAVTVAEFVRSSTFSSSGNFRPQSGSSAQAYAGVDLRGMGSDRTLVLIDGRRVVKAPNVGSSVDMNSIPMAAVERIEVLTDGASAIYGSDAIAGVINIILKKDFEGTSAMVGYSNPKNAGGEREEMSIVTGIVGDKGSMLFGASRTKREMVFTSQRPWGQNPGVSAYGNNYLDDEGLHAVPGGCTDRNYWLTPGGTCSYNFNAVAADEAAITNSAFFAKGEYRIDENWSTYVSTVVSRVESFGRYAPSLGAAVIPAGSPNDFLNNGSDITLLHRFAGLGNRDTTSDGNVYDIDVGVRGRLFDKYDVTAGLRSSQSKYTELGRNFVVLPIASQYIADGTYDILHPTQNNPDVLSAMKATISRDSYYKQNEAYANVTLDLFSMDGGMSSLYVAGEVRNERYADIYDSLSEAGVIGGSAGNSSAGTRKVGALTAEWLLPVVKGLDVDLAARFEKYNDYGNDFSPKASVVYRPISELALRASVGTGFRAPPINILHQKTTFSADSVIDPPTCIAFGGDPVLCQTDDVQVDTYYQANPNLKSEKSRQFSFGATYDPVEWMSVRADYWNIRLSDAISSLGAATLVDRERGVDPTPIPPGLGVIRNANGVITRVNAGYANEGTIKKSGIDLNMLLNFGLGEYGKLRNEFQLSYVLTSKTNDVDDNGTLGSPKYRATLNNSWSWGDFGVAWNINMIASNGSVAKKNYVGTYVTHDVQVDWDTPIKGGKLTLGVVNLGNKAPSLVPYDGRNFNFYLYDSYGRTPYFRYTQRF
ncbi:MAG: TonB-dependent receptor [Proteobacteria bacterium]|nr:TonB-dependent receptor [Pseudomonadota bacterium]